MPETNTDAPTAEWVQDLWFSAMEAARDAVAADVEATMSAADYRAQDVLSVLGDVYPQDGTVTAFVRERLQEEVIIRQA